MPDPRLLPSAKGRPKKLKEGQTPLPAKQAEAFSRGDRYGPGLAALPPASSCAIPLAAEQPGLGRGASAPSAEPGRIRPRPLSRPRLARRARWPLAEGAAQPC